MNEALTDREQQIANDAARKALQGLLEPLGVGSENPKRDLARLLAARALLDDEGFLDDLAFIRKLRTNADKITDAGIKTFVTVLVTGFCSLLLLGTKDWWLKHITG